VFGLDEELREVEWPDAKALVRAASQAQPRAEREGQDGGFVAGEDAPKRAGLVVDLVDHTVLRADEHAINPSRLLLGSGGLAAYKREVEGRELRGACVVVEDDDLRGEVRLLDAPEPYVLRAARDQAVQLQRGEPKLLNMKVADLPRDQTRLGLRAGPAAPANGSGLDVPDADHLPLLSIAAEGRQQLVVEAEAHLAEAFVLGAVDPAERLVLREAPELDKRLALLTAGRPCAVPRHVQTADRGVVAHEQPLPPCLYVRSDEQAARGVDYF